MANHKKTLEQKRKADQRRDLLSQAMPETASVSMPVYQFQAANKTTVAVHSSSPQTLTLAHGLEKTLVVSSIIVALQLALFFLLTHHIVSLPSVMLRY